MKRQIRDCFRLALLPAVAALALAGSAAAGTVTIDMNAVPAGGFPAGDGSSAPYLTATITDGTYNSESGVYLTLAAPGLGTTVEGRFEHVHTDWYFNVASIAGLTFTEISATGNNGFTLPVISTAMSGGTPHGSYEGLYEDEYFNMRFRFAEGTGTGDSQDGGVEFGDGDSVEYFISGLTSASFEPATLDDGSLDTYWTEAQIDDVMSGTWVTDGDPVPDGGWTLAMLAAALAPLAALAAIPASRRRYAVASRR